MLSCNVVCVIESSHRAQIYVERMRKRCRGLLANSIRIRFDMDNCFAYFRIV